jgi:hypothetical protein
MGILIGAIVLGLAPAFIASSKGRSFGLWWFYGAAIFIVALPHAFIIKASAADIERAQLDQGMKKCLHCAEIIKGDANVCRYCSRDVAVIPPIPNQI